MRRSKGVARKRAGNKSQKIIITIDLEWLRKLIESERREAVKEYKRKKR